VERELEVCGEGGGSGDGKLLDRGVLGIGTWIWLGWGKLLSTSMCIWGRRSLWGQGIKRETNWGYHTVASVQRLGCIRWALWRLSIHTGLMLGIQATIWDLWYVTQSKIDNDSSTSFLQSRTTLTDKEEQSNLIFYSGYLFFNFCRYSFALADDNWGWFLVGAGVAGITIASAEERPFEKKNGRWDQIPWGRHYPMAPSASIKWLLLALSGVFW
jgi:hypothetical protein